MALHKNGSLNGNGRSHHVEGGQPISLHDVFYVRRGIYPRGQMDAPHLLHAMLMGLEEEDVPGLPPHTGEIYFEHFDRQGPGWVRTASSIAGFTAEKLTAEADGLQDIAELEYLILGGAVVKPALTFDSASGDWTLRRRNAVVSLNERAVESEVLEKMAGLRMPRAVEGRHKRIIGVPDPAFNVAYAREVVCWLAMLVRKSKDRSMGELMGHGEKALRWEPTPRMKGLLEVWKKNTALPIDAMLIRARLTDAWYHDQFQNDAEAQAWWQAEQEKIFTKA